MKHLSRWLVLGVILLVAVGTPLLLQGKGDAAAGKGVFAKKCASCHGKTGEGNQRLAKMLKVELRELGSKEVQAKCDDALRKNTLEGVGKMKGVKGLSDADVANVLAYVRSLAKK